MAGPNPICFRPGAKELVDIIDSAARELSKVTGKPPDRSAAIRTLIRAGQKTVKADTLKKGGFAEGFIFGLRAQRMQAASVQFNIEDPPEDLLKGE